MLGDASSNVHMQYLREGVLMNENEENKLHPTSFVKVNQSARIEFPFLISMLYLQEDSEYPALATKDNWNESRDNLLDHSQTPIKVSQTMPADNEMISRPRHGG